MFKVYENWSQVDNKWTESPNAKFVPHCDPPCQSNLRVNSVSRRGGDTEAAKQVFEKTKKAVCSKAPSMLVSHWLNTALSSKLWHSGVKNPQRAETLHTLWKAYWIEQRSASCQDRRSSFESCKSTPYVCWFTSMHSVHKQLVILRLYGVGYIPAEIYFKIKSKETVHHFKDTKPGHFWHLTLFTMRGQISLLY